MVRKMSSFFFLQQMELLNFEGEILTADGGIMRRIKVKGEGYSNPNDGASVDGKLNICFTGQYLYD